MAEIIVALDFPHRDPALELAKRLRKQIGWFKVGLELYTAAGPSVVAALKDMGARVFLDLKFLDIPNTVEGAVRAAIRTGADMLTLHITGGENMVQAATRARDREKAPDGSKPLILGVTVLTSLTPTDLPWLTGLDIVSYVTDLASKGASWGLDGVVCSGHEAAPVKKVARSGFKILTPGIRLRSTGDDQRRTMTPREALRAGSDYLVVGRPITASTTPEHEAAAFLQEIR